MHRKETGSHSLTPPAERLIEAADKPLMVLALLAVGMYLLELRGILPSSGPVRLASMAIDALFVIDVLLKIAALRGRYLGSAWIMIDVLSCLPGILLVFNVPWLQAVQFTRLFRILRVLRGLRVLRSLQFMPVLAQLAAEQGAGRRHFRLAMNLGVALYAGAFIGILSWTHADFSRDSPAAADAEFFLVLGALVATALFLFIIHFEVRETSWNQLKSLLNVALPKQVADYFIDHPEAYHERHRAPATTMFMDFVGFSATAEKLRADVQGLAQHLERVMDAVVERLLAHDLIIDKFIGDAVMAFRGGPLVPGDAAEHARQVVQASLEAARALRDLNDPYFSRVKIGVASDECLIGAFGTSKRLSYTVLGDGVNLAARLEPASAQCGVLALFCDATRLLCAEMPGVRWRRWGTIRVKGKKDPQVVWEALDSSHADDLQFIARYENARQVFESCGPQAARGLFQLADAARSGGDPPSQLHIRWCDDLLKGGGADRVFSVSK